jgi:hypothetical protein
MRDCFILLLALDMAAGMNLAAAERERPVEIVASQAFTLKTPHGTAEMPFDVSLDWNQPQSQVTRAVVMFHGKGRDVDGYYKATLRAAELPATCGSPLRSVGRQASGNRVPAECARMVSLCLENVVRFSRILVWALAMTRPIRII